MSFADATAAGRNLIRRSLCPACFFTGTEQSLQDHPPEDRYYHQTDRSELDDPPRLWCPVDGQGYRLVGPDAEIRITSPCNGGLHAPGARGRS